MSKNIDDKVWISFIIPVYNSQKYLETCIESLIRSTMKQAEFIFIDDGSTDSSRQILEEYSARDERMIVLHQSNSGVSVTRNNGMQKATGRYLFFLDADDYLIPECWSEMDRYLHSEIDIVAYSYTNLFENGSMVPETIPFDIQESDDMEDLKRLAIASSWLNTCWGKLIRRDMVVSAQIEFPTEMKTGEDAVFMLRCVQNAYSCHISSQNALVYRHHPESAMKKTEFTIKMRDLNDLYHNRLRMVNICNDNVLRKQFYRNFFSVLTNLCFTIVNEKSLQKDRKALMTLYQWQGTDEILQNLDAKELHPIYKKLEFRLLRWKSITLLSAYFRMKMLF